jgi:MFS family permease
VAVAEPEPRESPARGATGPRAAARLLTTRTFGPYFLGNSLSATGTWFQNLAGALLVYRLTHSTLLLGVLNFGQFAPVLLLAPWAGPAADRFDKRRLLLATQLVSTALSGALALLVWGGLSEAWVVIAFGLGLGVMTAFSAPASQAIVGWLVPPEELSSAVGLNSMTYNVARATGPALAAVTVKTLGIPAALAINSASYVCFAAALLVVRPRPQTTTPQSSRLRDSLRLLREEPRLAGLLLIVTAVGFASDPVNTLAPAFARAFDRPDTWAGYIIGAFGAGAVTAALYLAGRITGSRRRMAVMLLLLGGGLVGFCLVPWLWLGLVILFVAGFGYLASNTAATSRIQLEGGEAQRGRMMALWSIAFLGLRPIASIIDGALASAFGVRVAGIVLAVPALAAAAAILCLMHRGSATSYTSPQDS